MAVPAQEPPLCAWSLSKLWLERRVHFELIKEKSFGPALFTNLRGKQQGWPPAMTSSPADRTAPVLPSQSRLQKPSQHRPLEAAPANLRQRGGRNLFEPQVYPEARVRAFNQISGHVTDPAISEFWLFILETLVLHNYGQCLKCLFLVFLRRKEKKIGLQ